MKPLTIEWVAKAEADYCMACRELNDADTPNFDGVCFHAQQAAEKYIKALLQEQEQPIPRSHDLPRLISILSPPIPALNEQAPQLAALSLLAVSTRYPGYFADQALAEEAVHIATPVRLICREVLGLDALPSA